MSAAMRIEVVYSEAPQRIERVQLDLPAGARLADALRASGLLTRHPEIDLARQRVGVWGRLCPVDQPLRDGDRVELYRGLQVDPKEARRLRYRGQRRAPR
jgi:putative ubiquitin-RnfH superfamily antitoxin RatB of RatAB toxin-antitoxin module